MEDRLKKEPTEDEVSSGALSREEVLKDVIRDLKQTDAAAERWRSTSKFLFKRTQGQVNSLGCESLLIE